MSSLTTAAFFGATFLAMLVLHRLLGPLLRRRDGQELLGENRATILAEAGVILALALVSAGVVKNCVHSEEVATNAIWCAGFAALGFVLIEVTGLIGTSLLLHRRLRASIARGNEAAGLAAALHYAATGIITAKAVAGSVLRGIGLSLAFFALAEVAQQALVGMFRALTTYDDAEQIDGENAAAAISYGGVSVAVALIVARALDGDFVDWPSALQGFGALVGVALVLFPVRQLIVQGLILGSRPTLRGGALDKAIGVDRNVGAAALEASAYLGTALAIGFLA